MSSLCLNNSLKWRSIVVSLLCNNQCRYYCLAKKCIEGVYVKKMKKTGKNLEQSENCALLQIGGDGSITEPGFLQGSTMRRSEQVLKPK